MQGLERSVVSVSSSGAAVGGFVPKTSRSPVSPVPDGCGSVPKENRNRADGRHTRCSRRTWPNIGALKAVTGYLQSQHRRSVRRRTFAHAMNGTSRGKDNAEVRVVEPRGFEPL